MGDFRFARGPADADAIVEVNSVWWFSIFGEDNRWQLMRGVGSYGRRAETMKVPRMVRSEDGTGFMIEHELAPKQTRQQIPASLHQSLIMSEDMLIVRKLSRLGSNAGLRDEVIEV